MNVFRDGETVGGQMLPQVKQFGRTGCIDCEQSLCDACAPTNLPEKTPKAVFEDQGIQIPLAEYFSRRKGDWMLTYGGRKYWPVDPRAEDVNIQDIAHALSMQCRYGGHAGTFYSVAEHSVLVSQWVPQEHALVALMHDATEAYVSDVPRPLKPHLSNYADIEQRNWAAIAEAFDLPRNVPACVHDVDIRLCKTEMTVLFGYEKAKEATNSIPGEKIETNISRLFPADAKKLFLNRFNQLWQEKLDSRFPAARMREVA